MSDTAYVPDERIIDKAVMLWLHALKHPKYQNAVPGSADAKKMEIVDILALAVYGDNRTAEKLDAFGVALKNILMTGTDHGAARNDPC